MERHPVTIIDVKGKTEHGVFLVDDDCDTDQCVLILETPQQRYEVQADDYFEAMCSIRRQLEDEGARLLCWGASRNVYPSPMSRSMGNGRKAYRLTLGKPAMMHDLVDIFAQDAGVQVATVEEQVSFYTAWLISLGTST
jgi:hypothetical protein